MTHVKICGITRMDDAQHAVACGAEMLGFNFYKKSPRYIEPASARNITASLPSSVETVGVFVNETSALAVRQIANEAGVTTVQLHGDESPEFCAALADFNVIKAFRVGPDFDLSSLANYSHCRILLDAATQTFGGSGARFDWNIARHVREQLGGLILAGGLNSESVGEAIQFVDPGCVDACSLLESEPGVKDPQKVDQFIAAVQRENLREAAQRFQRGIGK